jgi:hypothetical protein
MSLSVMKDSFMGIGNRLEIIFLLGLEIHHLMSFLLLEICCYSDRVTLIGDLTLLSCSFQYFFFLFCMLNVLTIV